jgi:hypothetical protein
MDLIGWDVNHIGGHAWKLDLEFAPKFHKYCLAASYGPCELTYTVSLSDFGSEFIQNFNFGKVIILAGCWMAKRWNCPAKGGCDLIVKHNENIVFTKSIFMESTSLPVVDNENKIYTPLLHKLKLEDFNFEMDPKVTLSLKIYGQSEFLWPGWFGPRFFGMFIRGDFSEDYVCLPVN